MTVALSLDNSFSIMTIAQRQKFWIPIIGLSVYH